MIYRGRVHTEEGVPSKSNGSTSGESFYQSYVYENLLPIYRPRFAEHQGSLRSFYGKVDTSGYIIYPREEFIKKIVTTSEDAVDEEPHYCLSLTKTCFLEFVRYYNRLRERGKVKKENSVLSEIKIARSWYNPEAEYYQHFMSPVNRFNRFNSDDRGIIEYDDYERRFMKLLEERTFSNKPVTMSETYLSSSPLTTGLFLEVHDGSYSDDAAKYAQFLRDDNFEVFRKAAKRFGFKLDKNIPWRIFIDFSSPYIVSKMEAAGFRSLEEFFSFYYDRVCLKECSRLRDSMRDAYTAFYGQHPSVSYFSSCGTQTQSRVSYQDAGVADAHYLKMYIHLRARETKKVWSQSKIDTIVSNILIIEQLRGLDAAVTRAESFFTDRSYDTFEKNRLTNDDNFGKFVGSSTKNRSSGTRAQTFNYNY